MRVEGLGSVERRRSKEWVEINKARVCALQFHFSSVSLALSLAGVIRVHGVGYIYVVRIYMSSLKFYKYTNTHALTQGLSRGDKAWRKMKQKQESVDVYK